MRIQYLGHSCFRIISDIGTTILTDPYNKELVGYSMPAVRCDLVTITHQHDDHNYVQGVLGNPAVLDSVVECALDDIAIDSFACYHDNQQGKARGSNLVYSFLVDGIKVAHLGDIGEQQQSIADRLEGTDVLLIPVGGYYTIDATIAKWYVDAIKPKVVIPMHYKCDDGAIDVIATLDNFLSLFDKQDVVTLQQDTFTLDDQPEYPTKVVVLDRMCQ